MAADASENEVRGEAGEAGEDRLTPSPDGFRPGDPGYLSPNLANRLFPGPSRRMSRQNSERVQALLKPFDGAPRAGGWNGTRDKGESAKHAAERRRAAREALEKGLPSQTSPPEPQASAAPPIATADDVAKLHDALDHQNELLQAILATSVETQTDARSTAQNSRTFAWAGTAIALLTLIATVVSIVAAIRAI